MSELLPCPFCGNPPKLIRSVPFQRIYCATCHIEMYGNGMSPADRWNQRVPAPTDDAPQGMDAPDEVDCDYWFDGIAVFRDEMIEIRDSVRVKINSIDSRWYAHIGGSAFDIRKMRGRWYKRDRAPWHGAKGEDNG